MKRATIVVPAAEALPRSTTVFDPEELDGMIVMSGDVRVGSVAGHIDARGGGVLEIERVDGGSILVPAVPEAIVRIDWDAGRLWLGETTPYVTDDELAT
jgi:ribosomal 30S subunit maturation factor RimM